VNVSEIFGPTVQGEGPSTGRRAGFVRLGRCDLMCSWCDTPYTWDWWGKNGVRYDPAVETRPMSTEEVVAELKPMLVHLVVITGGEPLVQASAVTELAVTLCRLGYQVEVETNGRHAPGPALVEAVSAFNVSPKLPNSGQSLTLTWRTKAIKAFAESGKARFKFVCLDAADVGLVAHLTSGAGIEPGDVWVMPEGRTAEEVDKHLGAVGDSAIAYGFNVTGRLHVQLWGGVRGR
jgi:7-carboxy-7-deazaguanine synthase